MDAANITTSMHRKRGLPPTGKAPVLAALLLALAMVTGAAGALAQGAGEAPWNPLPARPGWLVPWVQNESPSAPQEPEGEGVEAIVERGAVLARQVVGGQEITLAVVDQTVELRVFRERDFPDGATPIAKIRNNGETNFAFRYKTSETYLVDEPMAVGRFRLGYDFEFHYNSFSADDQILLNDLVGQDIGTSVSGQMLGGGPLIFVRLGPLYPESRLFWKAGGGVGAGLIEFEGTVLFRNNASPFTSLETVSHRTSGVNLFRYALWALEWDEWRVMFLQNNLIGGTDFGSFLYREASLVIGYTIQL